MHWRVHAPIRTASVSKATNFNAAISLMSISQLGRSSRNAIMGTRLCPPAMIFAASPCCDNSSQAASIEAARAYSKGGDFNGQPRRRCPTRYYQARLTATLLSRKITPPLLLWGATRPVHNWLLAPGRPLISMTCISKALVGAFCVALLALGPQAAKAQNYPSKPVTIVVGLAPGGP